MFFHICEYSSEINFIELWQRSFHTLPYIIKLYIFLWRSAYPNGGNERFAHALKCLLLLVWKKLFTSQNTKLIISYLNLTKCFSIVHAYAHREQRWKVNETKKLTKIMKLVTFFSTLSFLQLKSDTSGTVFTTLNSHRNLRIGQVS